ncbi:factor H binding protein domain-containing protein [Actinobacillus minor]|uniref:factor H binding protein domain-containing protein n=1 Tax=Actinobacillus minor TaxID=51047 RepID=UPI0026F2EF22|nr:factor H binding protein domain-containing protein [Actinobacillus minor]
MRLSVKTTAMAILVSLGVTACSSGGGGSSASNDNPEQAKQIEVLKKQVEAERQAVRSAQDNANQASEKVKASEAAKAKAEAELAKAQQALKDAENATAEEKAKAQSAADKAAKDLSVAQQALKNAESITAAEKAKAQAAANKAAQDLATAQQALKNAENTTAAEKAKAQVTVDKLAQDLATAKQALKNAENATAAEKAKAQAAADKAAQDLAEAQDKIASLEEELAPIRAEAERKRLEAEEEAKKWAFLTQSGEWRHIARGDGLKGYAEHAYIDGKAWYLYPIGASESLVLQNGIDFNKNTISNNVQILPVYASRQSISGEKQTFQVANVHFINQEYSTYLNWSYSDNINDDDLRRSAGYVALPTSQNSEYIKTPVIATYQGKALGIENYNIDTKNVYEGEFSLIADFKNESVKGNIANLNGKNYVLEKGNINISDQGNLIFSGKVDNNLDYKGVFSGPNAEEVVGTAGTDISFGGKRQ